MRTTWREAGHAVAALAVGARFSSASIRHGSASQGRGSQGRVHGVQGGGDQAFVIDAAGQIAERLRDWSMLTGDDELRGWLPTWHADGGDARRFRRGITARFSADEVAGLAALRAGPDPAAAADPPAGPGAARAPAAPAVPGRGGPRPRHLTGRAWRTGTRPGSRTASRARGGDRAGQVFTAERAGRDADGPHAGLHGGGHVRRGVADVGGGFRRRSTAAFSGPCTGVNSSSADSPVACRLGPASPDAWR